MSGSVYSPVNYYELGATYPRSKVRGIVRRRRNRGIGAYRYSVAPTSGTYVCGSVVVQTTAIGVINVRGCVAGEVTTEETVTGLIKINPC